MAKDTYYFNHDFNARNDEKILELRAHFGAEGYGIFWMIVETMAENENGGVKHSLIGGLSLGYGIAKETLKAIIDFAISIELFFEENGFLFSRRLKKYKEFRQKFSENGREGAEIRWKNRGANRGANGGGNAKERKGKENNKGFSFEEDFARVVFEDGSKQDLGPDQLELAKNGKLKPHSIIKGSKY